jgi:Ca2+-binding RTX toxin-like protein
LDSQPCTLIGNAGANTLHGWGGNDVLRGGAGKDMLTGGAGADRFVFIASGDSMVGAHADRITDFSRAQLDKIDLAAIDANLAVAGNQGFSFIGSGAFTRHAGELRFTVGGGVTTIAGDLNGDGVSDFHIVLNGTVALQASDFTL